MKKNRDRIKKIWAQPQININFDSMTKTHFMNVI